jgi:holo-[acyl-carrier protein] synthase
MPTASVTLLGTGVDVVDVPRFAAILRRRGQKLCEQVFTPRELADCRGRIPRLAARFAAKEATAKALGVGIGPIGWHEVEVRARPDGSPQLHLTGAAADVAERRRLADWAISLSHTEQTAIAIVVACAPLEKAER